MTLNSRNNPLIKVSWQSRVFLLAKPFKISRGSKTHAHVIVLSLSIDSYSGWSEAVPYARYNESIESTDRLLQNVKHKLLSIKANDPLEIIDKIELIIEKDLPRGSAKNLLDCALWDIKAKVANKSVCELLNFATPINVVCAQTLSVDTIDIMRLHAKEMAHLPLLKVKLDAIDVLKKMRTVHDVCPNSQFIVDANEAWSFELLDSIATELSSLNVVLIEQPLPANKDNQLTNYHCSVPLCADESCHDSDNVKALATKYQVVNIKLDKTGGLTEAVALFHAAKKHELGIMLGCMVASSLAMAPIFTLAGQADFIDLDGPVLVADDRENGFVFTKGHMQLQADFLWGKLF